MKVPPLRLANAFAISQGILVVLCTPLAYLAPNLIIRMDQSLVHELDITPLTPSVPRPFALDEFLIGLVSWAVFAWVSGWLLAVVYNAFVPNKADLG